MFISKDRRAAVRVKASWPAEYCRSGCNAAMLQLQQRKKEASRSRLMSCCGRMVLQTRCRGVSDEPGEARKQRQVGAGNAKGRDLLR